MKGISIRLLGVPLLGALLFSALPARADDNYGPKPLTAAPLNAPEAKPKVDPNAFPQEFIDARQKMKDDFNAWMKDDNAIQKQCNEAHTPVDRAACEKNKKISQARIDNIHAHMREVFRKIDAWRRKQAGLPPEPVATDSGNQGNGQTGSGGSNGSAKPNADAPLLPSNSHPLPAGTF